MAPGFTELDETQDLELQQQAWRDFVTSARANGDPDLVALLEADIKPKDLDSAFATVCTNEDVVFPGGEGACPEPEPALAALRTFWSELQSIFPLKSRWTQPARSSRRRASSGRRCVYLNGDSNGRL